MEGNCVYKIAMKIVFIIVIIITTEPFCKRNGIENVEWIIYFG